MKVLFISRASLYKDPGGDTIQVMNTARQLQEAGVQVDINLTNEPMDYAGYDLLHFFNIIRPADILVHVRKSNKPYVISPIFVNYAEYDQQQRKGMTGILFRLLSSSAIEYIKIVARHIFSGERIMSREYLWLGHRRSIRKVLTGASLLLPNSYSEYQRLEKEYGISKPYSIVPNGIDTAIFGKDYPLSDKDPNLVICVARIEGRKNQLNIIRALNNTRYKLLLVGQPSLNQKNYYQACKGQAAGNISFIDKIPQAELVSFYRKAYVHILPSWFETTGLSSLEAAAMGCNIVITDKGDAREYFGEEAWYCDPASPESIYEAIQKAAGSKVNPDWRKKIIANYTWQKAAQKTLEAYKQVLHHES